jgi:hypothetical protein
MSEPNNKALYAKVKREADEKYKTHGAYKSGWIVKTYKARGGTYSGKKTTKGLSAWFKESWKNIASKGQYPVLRPTKRINKNTPLTVSEISKSNLKKQVKEKQKIKNTSNLPAFKRATASHRAT